MSVLRLLSRDELIADLADGTHSSRHWLISLHINFFIGKFRNSNEPLIVITYFQKIYIEIVDKTNEFKTLLRQ